MDEDELAARVLAQLSEYQRERVISARQAAERREVERKRTMIEWNRRRNGERAEARRRHGALLMQIERTLYDVAELHRPHEGDLGIECRGCYGLSSEDYHDAEYPQWPCKTWVLIEAGESDA